MSRVNNFYALVFGGLLLLGDLHGHRRVFLIGVTLFGLASLVMCALVHPVGPAHRARPAGHERRGASPTALALLVANSRRRGAQQGAGMWGIAADVGEVLGMVTPGDHQPPVMAVDLRCQHFDRRSSSRSHRSWQMMSNSPR
jgi:MFS transporter, DHA2 family, multidrug resistance protein